MHAPPQWHEDRNVGMDAANKSGSEAGSDHGLWKGRVLKRVDVFELRFAQIQCDRLPPLRSPKRQENVLCPQSSMKAEQIQLAYVQPIRYFSPSLLVLDDVRAPNVPCFATYVGKSV